MDIDADSYPHQLLGLLIAISEADFVSFDLELTGIPSRLPGKERWKPQPANSDPKTLEDRYQETRVAAGRYQILQAGFTCARFDYSTDKYVLRPYNITLSPLLNEDLKLDIEREIHIQSGAATFLLNHGFDLGASFARGVQYLSRDEASGLRQRLDERLAKKPDMSDLQLKESDVQSLDFVRRVREAIIAWKQAKNMEMLEITTHTGFAEQPLGQVISRFEKRLVHQLVRAEFPELVTMGRNECIRIIHYDEMREEENKRRIKRRVKENIAKQTGFRWVFEALAADGNIHEASPRFFGSSAPIIAGSLANTKEPFKRAHERLQKYQPVLVGHNMFTDLVYFYRSFVGELPETLDKFCTALHEIFPRIIDTKYLATHAEGDLNASPTLQEIAEKIQDQPLPNIVTDSNHSKYKDAALFHEAGYDSLLTATILLRLSAKLYVDHPHEHDSDSDGSFRSAFEHPDGYSKPQTPSPPQLHLQPLHQEPVFAKKNTKKGKKGKKSKKHDASITPDSRFKSRNMFEQLTIEDQDTPSPLDEDQNGNNVDLPFWQDEIYKPDTSSWVPLEERQREPMELIPAWDTDFWQKFGNTLRVYGTQEAVLKVASWETVELAA